MASQAEVLDLEAHIEGPLLKRLGVSGLGIQQDKAGNPLVAVHLDDPSVGAEVASKFADERVNFGYTGCFVKQGPLPDRSVATDPSRR